MNAERRKAIDELLKIAEHVKEILDGKNHPPLADRIRELRDEEQDAYDNMPESLQDGEAGEKATESIEALDTAADEADNSQASVGQIIEYLEQAKGE